MSTLHQSNLLMTQPKINPEDQGVMNIGKNCYKCNQLDFLPFYCEFCKHVYCSNHRSLDVHDCVGRPQRPVSPSLYDGPTAASLFPDSQKRKEKLEKSFKDASPTTIKEQQQAKTGSKPGAMMKLTKFLHLQKLQRSGTLTSLFGKLKGKPSGTNKIAETSTIKKTAKGSNLVPAQDRVYIWVVFIDGNEETLGKTDITKQRKGVWISSKWSMGRALDSIADVLNIRNSNNSTQETSDRLNLFKVVEENPDLLQTSAKVQGKLTNGDTLYLVRGPL